jgi:hypothetical protein
MADLNDLVSRVRLVIRDAGTVPRFPTEEINEALADSQDEICERAYVLEDRTTVAVCKVVLTASTSSYTLHESVVRVESAVLYNDDNEFVGNLDVTDEQELTSSQSSWRSGSGTPTKLVITRSNTVIVTPIPTSDEVGWYIMLVVKRRPLNRLSDLYPTPEIASRYATDMVNWACYKYYLKDDVDTQDMKQATLYLGLFEASIGKRPSAFTAEAIKQQARHLHIKVRR